MTFEAEQIEAINGSQIEAPGLAVHSAPISKRTAVRFISRDEMNLAEFPLTVLSTRSDPSTKTLEFTDTIYQKSGKPINRKWIITGADKFGLPTASDDEVLLGLLKITVDQGLENRKVYFTRYELLKTLQWTTEGRSYTRLQNALDRLSGVRVKATNAFYDNESKSHSTRNFGILDAYEINNGRENSQKPSFFIWSEVLFKSFQVGFIKKLDLDFYLGLTSAVSRRLYRYLDKHFWYKSRVAMNIFTLAHEKIGISRNYRYPSSIRQQLDPAVEELVANGFLTDCVYEGRGKGTQVIFRAGSGKPRVLASQSSSNQHRTDSRPVDGSTTEAHVRPGGDSSADEERDLHSLVESLEDRGIKRNQGLRLLQGKSTVELEKISEIVSYYDSLLAARSHLLSKNPIGFLYRAVENPTRFVLPGEDPQTALDLKSNLARSKPKVRQGEREALEQEAKKKSRYLVYRKREIQRLRQAAEPELISKITAEVEKALVNVRGLISDGRFQEAVEHALEEKLAKLFALADFDEWCELGEP